MKTISSYMIFLFVFLCPFANFGIANPGVLEKIGRIEKLLQTEEQTLFHGRGQKAPLMRARTAGELFIACQNLNDKINTVGATTLSASHHDQIQTVYLKALQELTLGRATTRDHRNQKIEGWFLGHQDPNLRGKKEILDLLMLPTLSPETVQSFKEWTDEVIEERSTHAKAHGFDPDYKHYLRSDDLELLRAEIENLPPKNNAPSPTPRPSALTDASVHHSQKMEERGTSSRIPHAPSRAQPKDRSRGPRSQFFKDLLAFYLDLEDDSEPEESESRGGRRPQKSKFQTFLDELKIADDGVIYDNALEQLNLPAEQRVTFGGRDKELQSAFRNLRRVDRSHLMLTGKAGIGKTTFVGMLQKAELDAARAENRKPAIYLQLSITLITNDRDPSALELAIRRAREFSKASGHEVILFFDEAQSASKLTQDVLKPALSRMNVSQSGAVRFVMACTGDDSIKLLKDPAFARRWSQTHLEEFTVERAIEVIENSKLKIWRQKHIGIQHISQEAYAFAAEYAKYEQPYAGRPTNMIELLEGAIIYSLDTSEKGNSSITLEPHHIREYLKSEKSVALFPGDPNFESDFEILWQRFKEYYPADEGFLDQIRKNIRFYFLNRDPEKVPAWLFLGPPGAGKSYLYDVISEIFFNSEAAVINASDLGKGPQSLNKLIGSSLGTRDSSEAGILVKAITGRPQGGTIVIEEADYLSPDILKWLVNTLTSKTFRDGTGNEYDISRYIFVLVSNQGQEMVLPQGGEMTWEKYTQILESVTDNWQSPDGTLTGRTVKPEVLAGSRDKYLKAVFAKSEEAKKDTATIEDNADKFRRRLTNFYLFGPEKKYLEKALMFHASKIQKNYKKLYKVNVEFTEDALKQVLDIENFKFSFGYAYVKDRISTYLDTPLSELLSEIQGVTDILVETKIEETHPTLVFKDQTGRVIKDIPVLKYVAKNYSLWTEETFNNRLRDPGFVDSLNKLNPQVAESVMEGIERKLIDPKQGLTMTFLGSKLETRRNAEELARVLYGEPEAFFSFDRLINDLSLGAYLRPPGGIRNSDVETHFEKWLKSRIKTGGVILLDGLLDLDGLTDDKIAEKRGIIDQLITALNSSRIEIGPEVFDVSSFTFVVSGRPFPPSVKGDELNSLELHQKLEDLGITGDRLTALGTIRFLNVDTEGKVAASIAQKYAAQGWNPEPPIQGILNFLKSNLQKGRETSDDDLAQLDLAKFLNDSRASLVQGLDLGTDDLVTFSWQENSNRVTWLANERPTFKISYIENGIKKIRWVYADDAEFLRSLDASSLEDLTPQPTKFLSPKARRGLCNPSHLSKVIERLREVP
jgi:ATP-dependent Clp protease ATP-binding subunit ClpA